MANLELAYKSFLLRHAVKWKYLKTPESGAKMLDLVRKSIDGDKEAKVKLVTTLNKSLDIVKHVIYEEYEQLPKEFMAHINRMVSMGQSISKAAPTAGAFRATDIQAFTALDDELQSDTNWMAAYTFDSVTDSPSANIIDFDSFVVVEEFKLTEAIEAVPFGNEANTILDQKRFGVAINIPVRWLETNQRYNVNNIVEAVRAAYLRKKADFHYDLIGATSGVTIQTSGGTDLNAFITALNSGARKLIEANADKGFGVASNSPLLLYSRLNHIEQVLQAIERQIGSETNNTKLRFSITPNFTSNTEIAVQPGTSGKDGVYLVLPNRKIRSISFRAEEQQMDMNFSTHSQMLISQEYWNASAPSGQRFIVDITN